jgi:hypothetical protein
VYSVCVCGEIKSCSREKQKEMHVTTLTPHSRCSCGRRRDSVDFFLVVFVSSRLLHPQFPSRRCTHTQAVCWWTIIKLTFYFSFVSVLFLLPRRFTFAREKLLKKRVTTKKCATCQDPGIISSGLFPNCNKENEKVACF